MKILFIQCFDSPEGQSNRSYQFAKALDRIGYDVSFFTNRYNHLDGDKKISAVLNNNIKHYFVENRRFKNSKFFSVILNCYTLFKTLKVNEPDIIIGPSVPLLNSFIGLMAKNKRTKFIYEIRDVWPDAMVFSGKISKLNPIYMILKIMEIFIYKKSDGLISALPKTFEYVGAYNKQLPQLYLPNSYHPYPSYKKKFNKKKIKIIYIGRFNNDHDVEIILESAKYLLYERKIKNISFDLYGYGKKLNYIENYKSENNLTNLNIQGKVEKNKIHSLSKKYDLALCTLSNSKTFKWGTNLNKIYEYFNSSMPVIFSGKVQSNPVVNANCGFISENYNYIDLSKKIIMFSRLENNEKEKMSYNAKKYFDTHYNIKLESKKLDIFLKTI